MYTNTFIIDTSTEVQALTGRMADDLVNHFFYNVTVISYTTMYYLFSLVYS